jgi:hypothetical protein
MKLSYRGVHYEQDPLTLAVNEGEIGGKYRGQDWKRHQPRHIPQLQPKLYRQYRGIAYSSSFHLDIEPSIAACSMPRPQPTIVTTDEVSQVHLETIRRRLERRLEIALARGDNELVRLLKEESQALNLNIV